VPRSRVGGFPSENPIGKSWFVVVDCYVWVYPPVNVNKKLWKEPPFFMGKYTISMAIFNSYITVSLPEGISH
jgi:hypothetical protein